MLDLQSVRLFVLAADLGSLTKAAQAEGTVQPVVSQRIKALEAMLGRKLLERTPRFVRPTGPGEAFLERARALLAMHEDAVRFVDAPSLSFAVGISDQAVGARIESVLKTVRAALPHHATVEVRTGLSQDVKQDFDSGRLDAAIVRREAGGSDGQVLGTDPLGWRAAEGFSFESGAAVPLAMLAPPCGTRAVAVRELDAASVSWREAFIGGSCAALLAGVRAGLGVAPMGRTASADMPDRGGALGLPPLPRSEIVLFARAGSPEASAAIRVLDAAVRSVLTERRG
ncbi:LysR family transcriptional regulator [Marinivivus vitaminiproducens]|uniref:LysR family transcriptional regulator n=1 Tax=Marinivivus vitaminiproducens TaxID=3035935 RepID=UPI0027A76AEF|nr:LysR family transcriptional regulator [Geminicoccaceae bacterium SCSIO 64248]